MNWLSTLSDPRWQIIEGFITIIAAIAILVRFFCPGLYKRKVRFSLTVIICFIAFSIVISYVLPYLPSQNTIASSIQSRTNTAPPPSVTPSPPVTTQTQPSATPSDSSQLSPVETIEQSVAEPPSDALIICGGRRDDQKYWYVDQTDGYGGSDSNGTPCRGFSYIQIPTSLTSNFFPDTQVAPSTHSIDIWVYILDTTPRGVTALVAYNLEFHTPSGLRRSESWIIDQSRYSGWLYLGTASIPPDTITFTLVLSSDDSNPDHFLAEDAAAMRMHA
ncbi:MAG TPA: hypothetical protein VFB60_20710 [Ktedonobacteraceae bacterium]|nr:hypothetical protein [Ktedonobacteraceae bacterium]